MNFGPGAIYGKNYENVKKKEIERLGLDYKLQCYIYFSGRSCAYQGVRNVSFLENFPNVIND